MPYIGVQQVELVLKLAAMIGPVALYFFIIGFLNTRTRPQLLSGRQEFIVLTVALSPLVLGPLIYYFGDSPAAIGFSLLLLALCGFFLAPRDRSLVVYNISRFRAGRIATEVLEKLGKPAAAADRGVTVDGQRCFVELSGFPLLGIVTVRMTGGDDALWDDFRVLFSARVRGIEAVPRAVAVSMLLIATAMLVAPAALVVRHAPEIVRLLGDLVR